MSDCSTVAAPFYILIVVHEGSYFSTFSPTLVIFLLFSFFFPHYYSHPSGFEVASHCSFDLHSLMTNDVEHLSMGLLAICVSLEKCIFKSSAHLKKKLGRFLFCSLVVRVPCGTCGIWPFPDKWLANIFSHSVGCLFTFFAISSDAQKF